MIQHTVVFRLIHAPGSAQEKAFLATARQVLPSIPGVTDFEVNTQVSPKSEFTTQFSMRFADEAAYAAYDAHPDHRAFVADLWVPEVAEFQEYDFVAREP